ncbi:MAG: acetyl-CoA acetyltransferase [Acidimicrobiales bacterium]
MRLDPSRTPVVLATGQALDRSSESGPLLLAKEAARTALEAAPGVASRIERLSMVNILGHRAGPAPASDLSKALGIAPRAVEVTVIGGNMPQTLVTRAAAEIAAGRLSATLIVGAEALRSTRLKPQGSGGGRRWDPASNAEPEPDPDPTFGTERQDLSDEERAAGLLIPVFVYPLFESVLAARQGRSNAEQRAHVGRFLAPFSTVAATNPYAWFAEALTAEQIAEPSPTNRLVAEPYTKRMTAFLGSAHASALVVTSLDVARQLGLGDDVVFVWSGADAEEIWNPISRPDLGRSPALGRAASALFRTARVTVDDIAHFDLYSCFPSAVELAAGELGLALDDPRGLTVTGGLPYFGGPGSSYVGHSIATMTERLRAGGPAAAGSHALGLVNGVGWYMTRHAVGLYGTAPPGEGFRVAEPLAGPAGPGRRPPVPVGVTASVSEATTARVEAGTVIYDRAGVPLSAPVIASLPDGTRIAANAWPEALVDVAELGSASSLVGRTVQVGAGTPPQYSV